ncbi:SGNH/GDSL hydrolase family protein [Acinetobacter pittii]|uniref:SGNH/GDSL hydrolase family protein n=1 Tax=Acinetobacter pittii TaxID=48296 RepID=UPI002A02FFFE|nr:SGNH/GDSL hydrolase family protein [Acinetobacter pittii]MDX8253713.1 SGNH/GDSL hydrolase family protein [Acinetobacter pittii]
MPLPSADQFIGQNVTESGFKQAQTQLIEFLEAEVPTNEKLVNTFATKAIADSKTNLMAIDYKITVISDPEESKNGDYTWNGTELVKSPYDPLNQAKIYTNERVGMLPTKSIVPLAVDQLGNVPIWLEDGAFDFANSKALGKSERSSIIPLVADEAGNVPVWLEDGALGFSTLSLDTFNFLSNYFQSRKYQTNVFMGQRPINTDSASLRQWKAKVAKIKSGITDQLRVVLAGDSWAEHSTIATELKTILQTAYGEAGSGWINLGAERNMLDGITITYGSGWTVNDLDSTSAAFPYGCGPDGFTRTSTTAGSTITLANLTKGDQLTVFFGNTGGIFSYTINGVETNVTASSAKKVQISLNNSTSVILKVISGTICFFGMHLRKTTGSGVEFNKVGNGNSTGQDYLKISPAGQAEVSSFLNPDVLIIILGTNDYRRGHSVANFQAGIMAMIDGFKSASPNCAVILVAPAQTSVASPPIPLVNFVEAAFELIYYRQTEVYNMFDDWGLYDLENSNGQWADTLHVSKSGAYRLSRKIFKTFLEL